MSFNANVWGTVSTANGGNMTPGLPAGVATGWKLLCLVAQHDDVLPTMTGWTPIYRAVHPNVTTVSIHAFEITYDAGSPPTNTVSRTGGNRGLAVIVGSSAAGAISVDTFGAPTSSASSTSTITFPDADPSQADCMIIWHWSIGGTGPLNGQISGSNPTPTERVDQSMDTLHALGFADGIRTVDTAIGGRTSTAAANGNNMGAVIILKEAAAGGAGPLVNTGRRLRSLVGGVLAR